MFFSRDITDTQIDQNEISKKSARNGPTSQKYNFIENGRTRLVYDSFWPQGPPKLQKIGLGWFPPFVRHPRTDLRFFSDFSRISSWDVGPRKQIFQPVESEKNVRKLIFFQISHFSQKLWYFSSILVYSHRSYSQYSRSLSFLKAYRSLFYTNRILPILKTSLL